jgi:hypothetical protein
MRRQLFWRGTEIGQIRRAAALGSQEPPRRWSCQARKSARPVRFYSQILGHSLQEHVRFPHVYPVVNREYRRVTGSVQIFRAVSADEGCEPRLF